MIGAKVEKMTRISNTKIYVENPNGKGHRANKRLQVLSY